MKFSHQLDFNVVPDWRKEYLNYEALKKDIYAIAKAEAGVHHAHDEDEALLGSTVLADQHSVFEARLQEQLHTISQFFLGKEASARLEFQELMADVERQETQGGTTNLARQLSRRASIEAVPDSAFARQSTGGVMDESVTREARVRFWKQEGGKSKEWVKQRVNDLFVDLTDLKQFLEHNHEGFRKILKKHDKVTNLALKESFMPKVDRALAVSKYTSDLVDRSNQVADLYGIVYMQGDSAKALDVLTRMLRDQIKVERSTVWRDMVAMERKTGTTTIKSGPDAPLAPFLRRHWTPVALFFSIVIFLSLLWTEIFSEPEKQNCLAMLALVSLLWATEAIPLYTTSMMVAPLAVLLKVCTKLDAATGESHRLRAQDAAPAMFHAMFSQTIMLLLGGFAIAAALSKHFIAKRLAILVMSRVGRRPRNVLLASMFVAAFASMWISNVAAPVLTFSIVMPILKTLDTSNSFAKSLVMGIALASNIGGMTSPISSPQNIFAIERMSMDGDPPSWLSWFAVSLPVSGVCILMLWGLILLVYQPWRQVQDVRPLKPNTDPMSYTQVYVIMVSLATVALWCLNSQLQDYTGEMGVVAVLPLVAFFGFGVLDKDDFNGFLWNVVMLAMGGLALGEAVKSSGLLAAIALEITTATIDLDQYTVLLIFCLLVLICTTFISHTVGAMVILPIVQRVGEDMPGGHPKLLVMATALMCSGAMGLPVSGFPNMNAVALEDESTGLTYVQTIDFLKVGVPGSLMAYGVVVSLGYLLMKLVQY
ncbi:hypothetical protein FOA52_014015 [Chlamydomonas sp. UWO 241]|nr:hypothetical protein FOA52_014015 [Chlamydomonas sp. UWO 241]